MLGPPFFLVRRGDLELVGHPAIGFFVRLGAVFAAKGKQKGNRL